jgi:hypothetical protein
VKSVRERAEPSVAIDHNSTRSVVSGHLCEVARPAVQSGNARQPGGLRLLVTTTPSRPLVVSSQGPKPRLPSQTG